MLPSAHVLVAIVSGVALVLFGLVVLLARVRPPNLYFALFSVAWGLQVILGNLTRVVTDANDATALLYVDGFLISALTLFLLAFAGSSAAPATRLGRATVIALAVPSLLALALFLLDPRLLLADLAARGDPAGTWRPVWTPLASLLIFLPSFGAFYFSVAVFARRAASSASDLARVRHAFLTGALAIYVAYATGENLTTYLLASTRLVQTDGLGVVASFIALFATGTLVLTAVVWGLLRRRSDLPRPARDALVAAIAIPMALGVGANVLPLAGLPRLEFVGLARTVSVLALVYGILRYQVFDIDLRLKRVLPKAGVPVAFGLALLVAAPAGVGLALGVALAASLVAAFGGRSLAGRLFPSAATNPEYLYARKVEVYQTALEGMLAHGEPDEAARAWLDKLRRHLGLSEREHRVLELAARGHLRAKPLVGRAGGPTAVAGAKYEILGTLGQGTFGTAHLARHTALERLVVLKELRRAWLGNPRAEKAFLDEARRAARIRHPRVVEIYDVETEGGAVFMVLEHMPGGTLEELVRRHGPLPWPRAATLLDDVLAGLEALHAAGIVHRDVAPGNVFLTEDGHAKLGDLGIATDLAGTGTAPEGGALPPGTVPFMSPEQAAGARVDARSDLYAAAALLHFALTGEPPVPRAALAAADARARIAGGAVALGPGLPEPAVRLLTRALAREPAARFATAAEFRAALTAAPAPRA